jgi:hypothetical protein
MLYLHMRVCGEFFASELYIVNSKAATLLNQIYRLPVSERMLIVERTVHSIRAEKNDMANAVALMMDEYYKNKELTAFTQLDMENLYTVCDTDYPR